MIECPGCGGNLKFDIASQKMHCDYCDSMFDPYDFDGKQKDAEEQELYEVTVFVCPQCGGELYSTDNAAAAFCSFCGASTILYSRIEKENRPDYIIPFKKTKEDCKREYMKKVNRAFFLPKQFKDKNCIESFRGIYMPYWSYNIKQQGEISLKAEQSHREGNYIIHNHYNLTGEIDAFYHGITHDASSTFADSISECLQPYNVREKKEFTPGFLSGFYADTPDVKSRVYEKDAQRFAYDTSAKMVENVPEFQSYTIKRKKDISTLCTETRNVDAVMFPVWFMSYRNKDRVAYAAVNGQTGKVVADLPIAPERYLAATGIVAAVLFLILNIFATMKPSVVLWWAMALGVITAIIYGVELGNIAKRLQEEKKVAGSRPRGKKRTPSIENKTFQNSVGFFFLGAAELIGLVIQIVAPVSDWFYYGGVILGALGIAGAFLYVIRCYNIVATRRLPQFAKKGGDDRA